MQAQEQDELTDEEKTRLFVHFLEQRRKHFVAKRGEETRNKPPTRAQERSIINEKGEYLVDYRTELVEESSKKAEAEIAHESSLKRAGEELEQESFKKQKLEEDKESEELKQCLEIIPDDGDDVTIDATPLSTKSPTIVDYKIYKEGKKSYFQIIRADGNSQMYLTFGKMLKNFDREDLETMFEHHIEDNVWKNQQGLVKVLNWKLYDSCRVHCVTMQNMLFYMLVEKIYPLTNHTLHQMFNDVKLQVDYVCEMAFELLRLVKKQLKEGYISSPTGGVGGNIGITTFRNALRAQYLPYSTNGVHVDYEKIIWEDLIHKLNNKTREKIIPYPRFLSLLQEHMMPEYEIEELTINPTQVFSVHNLTLKPNQPEEPPLTDHMKAICNLDVLVDSKAPKPSSNVERVPQGTKPGAKPGHKKHSTFSKQPSVSSKEATEGSNPSVLIDKTKSAGDGLKTAHTDSGANEESRVDDISLKVKLEDLSDILKDIISSFFTPDSPPDEPIIISDESEEEEEVAKDKVTKATSHDVLETDIREKDEKSSKKQTNPSTKAWRSQSQIEAKVNKSQSQSQPRKSQWSKPETTPKNT
ncbi:hypothetical protein Tco_0000190 [Tanacetum coccineum]